MDDASPKERLGQAREDLTMKTQNNSRWLSAVAATLTAFAPVVGAIVIPTAVTAPAYAQSDVKIYMTDGQPKKGPNGKPVPQPKDPKTAQEAIAATNLTDTFVSKNGQYNVFAIITYTSAKPMTFKALVRDASGKTVEASEPKSRYDLKMAAGFFIMNTPGSYTLEVYDSTNMDKPVATAKFTVTDPAAKAGTPAAASKAGTTVLTICKSVDDNWKAVEPSTTWKANEPFNVLITNGGKPFGVPFLGIIIHKQGENGEDVGFENEYEQTINEKTTTMYATESGFRLPAGKYTIYIIDWYKREINTHNGNFKTYFAKVTLTVTE